MTTLSLFLWLSNVVGNLGFALEMTCFFAGIIVIFGAIGGALSKADDDPACSDACFKTAKKCFFILLVAATVRVLLPTTNTMHLILGVETLARTEIPNDASELYDVVKDRVLNTLKETKK